MPVSKKPRGKPQSAAERKAAAGPALPDRRTMEAYLAAIAGGGRDDAVARAQEVMYERLGQDDVPIARGPRSQGARHLAALRGRLQSPGRGSGDPGRGSRPRRAPALEAGELALGPQGFEEYDGHFWGFLETRPYMRARHGLALTLLKLGEEAVAMEHFRVMLKLNPNDNQGIRYLLLGSLLRRRRHSGSQNSAGRLSR